MVKVGEERKKQVHIHRISHGYATLKAFVETAIDTQMKIDNQK